MKKYLVWIMVLCVMIVMVGCGRDEAATAEQEAPLVTEAPNEQEPVTIVSEGKEIIPIKICYDSENWDEEMNGWVKESASVVEEEIWRKAPEVLCTEDISVKLAESVHFDRINLVDMQSGEILYTTDLEALKGFRDGNYYADLFVTKYGKEYDGKQEYWKYSCTFKLITEENTEG